MRFSDALFRALVTSVLTWNTCLIASDDRLADESAISPIPPSPDWSKIDVAPPGSDEGLPKAEIGPIAPAARQPTGALSGRLVFMNCGHGWTFTAGYPWRLLRGTLNEMNEDYGNIDQLNMFATYCFNAGAVVIPCRPLGFQTNEVVLDNDSPGVTYSGTWLDSAATSYFFGSVGDVPYRYANLAANESATATYTPSIPLAGYYPVYCWAAHGANRADQLYRIRHTGGESQVRIPHYLVGNGWIYLGEYYFNSGSDPASGSVVISNLRSSTNGSVVIADAIRFGNGMGSIDRGAGVSGYPREDENTRYWVQAGLGVGMPAALYDSGSTDESDSWTTPPMISAEMNREAYGTVHQRIHISFHSNAGGGRGTLALITSDPTTNQAALAQLCGKEVNDDLVALGSPPLELAWNNRSTVTYTGGYSEIDGSLFNYEMPATIIEVAFHDDASDARLIRDPKARAAVGKAAMHAAVKYFNQYGGGPLAFLPEPPSNTRATGAAGGNITLAWNAPVSSGGSGTPTNYVIYRSSDGFGFGNPIMAGNVTSYTVTGLTPGTDYYFRISASNAGGESLPSEVVGCRTPLTNGAARVLVVNSFDRLDRATNLRQDTTVQNYRPPGNSGTIERVWPRRINAFDYVVAFGKAVSASATAFDSCQNETVINNQVGLSAYSVVVWSCGGENTNGSIFNATEQSRITAYLGAGGSLFASGANIAHKLGGATASATDRSFLAGQLHTIFTNESSGAYTTTPAAGGLLAGRASATLDDGTRGTYWLQSPDVIGPAGSGATQAITYTGGGGAAVQYDGAAGGGRVVLFGFPFETITSSARRAEYMASILTYLSQRLPTNVAPSIASSPVNQTVFQGKATTVSLAANGTLPLSYQWLFNGIALTGATSSDLVLTNAQAAHSGLYQVIVTNAFGSATSQVARLEVALPFPTLFADNFDANTASNWVINRSSSDTRVTFNYNYAADGIASAPGSGGTTRGLKFEANLTLGIPAALSVSPLGGNFTDDYALRFELWLNANGPFPLGGVGSTEHATAGVGTAGNRVEWNGTGSTADGFWFAVDGEGQAPDAPVAATTLSDYCAFSGSALHAANSGIYGAGTASNSRGNGNTYYTSAFPGGQSAPARQQSSYPQQTGTLAAGTIGMSWRELLVKRAGTTVEWFVDGVRMATITNAVFTANNIFVGYYDSFASVSDNDSLSFGLIDNVRVESYVTNVPPYLTAQPLAQTVRSGSSAVFSVTAGGTAPLRYQWFFAGNPIAGATLSSYNRPGVRAEDAGNYSAIVTNSFGSVLSSNAPLMLLPTLPLRLNVTSSPTGGRLLSLSGEPGSYRIEVSSDLLQWVTWTNAVVPEPGSVQLEDTTGTNAARFYRAATP